MRRAILAGVATVVGVAYILNFKVSPQSPTRAELQLPKRGAASPAEAPPDPSASAPAASPSPGGSSVVDGIFTGPSVFVRFGNVQVRVTVAGGVITEVQSIELPADRTRSAEISQHSGPILRQETIRAQSAHIDVVSGATYTSYGFTQSLEAALQQAHLG